MKTAKRINIEAGMGEAEPFHQIATVQTLINKSIRWAEHDLLKRMGMLYITQKIANILEQILNDIIPMDEKLGQIRFFTDELKRGELPE